MSIVYYKKLQNIFKIIFAKVRANAFSCKNKQNDDRIKSILQVCNYMNVKMKVRVLRCGCFCAVLMFCNCFN